MLAREHARPAGIALEGKGIEMRRHIARTARVAVLVPSAADIFALLDDQEVFHSRFEELDAHADAGEACTYNEHINRNACGVVTITRGIRHDRPILHSRNRFRQRDCEGIWRPPGATGELLESWPARVARRAERRARVSIPRARQLPSLFPRGAWNHRAKFHLR